MAEEPGTRLGPYRLVAPIGSGGFATVYRAVDERLDAEVAIKVLAENHALDLELRERFLREAQLLRRVACEAVVPLYDLGETPRAQPYLVLAFADRGDLRARVAQRLATGNPITPGDLQTVADTLAVALGRAHRVGLVHRDVKPTNLLIASTRGEPRGRPLGWSSLLAVDERLLLGDLGLAKDLTATSGLTVGTGTLGFNAPEQRTGAGQVDVRADVYGASAVLFWMATGAVPPERADERAAVLAQAAPPTELPTTMPTTMPVTMPVTMRQAILRGLADRPEDRFATIEDWHRTLSPADTPGADGGPGRSSGSGLGPGGGPGGGPGLVGGSGPGPLGAGAGAAGASGDQPAAGRRPARVGAVVAALVVAVVGAGILYRVVRSGAASATDPGDGLAHVTAHSGNLTAEVDGPRSVVVGQPASFAARAEGAANYRWFTPDGQVSGDSPLVLRSSVAGKAMVTLVAADAEGHTVTVEFPFTVTNPG